MSSQPSSSKKAHVQTGDLAYDPDMDAAATRKIRKEYRDLLSNQAETRANLTTTKVSDLIANLGKVDSLFTGVKRAQEATLDSKAVNNLSEMAALKARAMKHSVGGFDVDDFIAKLITFMGGRSSEDAEDEDDGQGMLDWEKVGYLALQKSRRVIGPNFMLGPLSIEQKKRTTTKRATNRAKANPKENVMPEELDHDDRQKSENNTATNVKQISDILESFERVNYFRLVLNPESFSQSVENIFYFSFLIRDGSAAWEFDENREPMVYATVAPTQEDYQNKLRKKQAVLELDMETWKNAIEVFNIREPLIPTRPPVPDKDKFPSFKRQRAQQPESSDNEDVEVETQVDDEPESDE